MNEIIMDAFLAWCFGELGVFLVSVKTFGRCHVVSVHTLLALEGLCSWGSGSLHYCLSQASLYTRFFLLLWWDTLKTVWPVWDKFSPFQSTYPVIVRKDTAPFQSSTAFLIFFFFPKLVFKECRGFAHSSKHRNTTEAWWNAYCQLNTLPKIFGGFSNKLKSCMVLEEKKKKQNKQKKKHATGLCLLVY